MLRDTHVPGGLVRCAKFVEKSSDVRMMNVYTLDTLCWRSKKA